MAERQQASVLKPSGTAAISCSGRLAASTQRAGRNGKWRPPAVGTVSSLDTLPPLLMIGEIASVLRTATAGAKNSNGKPRGVPQ
jgi:hypothetical protein